MVPAALAQGQGGSAMPYIPPKLNVPPPAKIRFQSEDLPAPAPVSVPTVAPAPTWTGAPAAPVAPVAPVKVELGKPEQLGIQTPTASVSNWTEALAQLESLGMVNFQVQQVDDGWRFVCQMKTQQEGRHQRIEVGPVASKAEAIRLALVEAGRR